MQIIPVQTPVIKNGDDICSILSQNSNIQAGDILVISSKALATAEGAAINLSAIIPSDEAKKWAGETGLSSAFCEAVMMETKRLNGKIHGSAPKALLTELKPEGLEQGVLLVPNAGMDQSNVERGFAIGWPVNPVQSGKILHEHMTLSNKPATSNEPTSQQNFAVILSDSCVQPRRWGVTAFALVSCGLDPLKSDIGSVDLFGKPLTITVEAIADQLAVAANAVMGNAGQSMPAAIIRDHGLPFSDYCGWVNGMKPEEDLFRGFL